MACQKNTMRNTNHVSFVSDYKRWDFVTINNPLLKKNHAEHDRYQEDDANNEYSGNLLVDIGLSGNLDVHIRRWQGSRSSEQTEDNLKKTNLICTVS